MSKNFIDKRKMIKLEGFKLNRFNGNTTFGRKLGIRFLFAVMLLSLFAQTALAASERKEIVFVENNLTDYQTLIDGVGPRAEVVVLDASKDGLEQMALWAKTHSGYDAIHILSHGSPGRLNLGSAALTTERLEEDAVKSQLVKLGQALTEAGDLLIYGCDVSAGDEGKRFINKLAMAAGADVAASTDGTGAISLGGDWELEAHAGTIDVTDGADLFSSYTGMLTVVMFDASDLNSGSGVYNKTVSSVGFTLTGPDGYSFSNNYGINYNVFPDSAGNPTGDATKVTIAVASGYTFDFNGFSYYTSLNDTITVTFTSAQGATTTGSLTATANSNVTVSNFSAFKDSTNTALPSMFDDVTKVVIVSQNGTGGFDFGTNSFDITDVKLKVTAPVITSQSASAVTSTTANLQATSSGNGTMYYVITTSPSVPTAAQVVAGLNSTGATAYQLGSSTITASTAHTFNLTGLAPSTRYYYYLAATDASGNKSAVSTGDFITTALPAPTFSSDTTASFAENAVGTVYTAQATASSGGGTVSYSITGGADQAEFSINSTTGELAFVSSPNYESPTDSGADHIYNVTITATDSNGSASKAVAVTVTNVNETPTDISLSNGSIAESAALASTVGTFSTVDVDTGNTFTYSLVSGTGGDDNASFSILGNSLKTAAAFAYNTRNSYTIRVRSTDSGGLSYDKSFTISITEVNAAPTDITLTGSHISENTAPGTTVGTFTTADSNTGDTSFTYTLQAGGVDNASFSITGNTLQLAVTPNYEVKSSYTVLVRSTDPGGLFYDKSLTIRIDDVNEAPADISLSNSTLAENLAAGSVVGTLTSTDPDSADTFAYTLVGGAGSTDNGSFTISGSTLILIEAADYEAKSSYSIRVRSTDSGAGNLYVEKGFTIYLSNTNEAPLVTNASKSTPIDTPVSGSLQGHASDAEQDSLTYEVVGQGQLGSLVFTNSYTGDYVYTPIAGLTGTDTVTYRVNDGSLYSNTASLRINIMSAEATGISSLNLSSGSLSPAFDINTLDYTASVGNSTSSITVVASVYNKYSNLMIGGSQVTVTGSVYEGSKEVTLSVGSNIIEIEVTAQDGVTKLTYILTITRAAGTSDHHSTSTSSANTTDTASADVLVNGKVEKAGKATTQTTASGQEVTTIAVDPQKIEQKLQAEGNYATITIPVNIESDIVVGQLDGQTIKMMENKQAVLELKTRAGSYIIPAAQINIDSVSALIGQQVQLKDIKVSIEIARVSEKSLKVVEDSAKAGSFTIVAPPVEYAVKLTSGDKTVEVSQFNSYVERTIAIPDGVDPSKITTGVVIDADGTSRHVPTKVYVDNGQYYAKISSLSNSTYSVVWHPYEFKDVATHWAKQDVNDIGSRMVVSGTQAGIYEPDRNITRAEFAAIMVKALGLKPGMGSNPFADVKAGEWYANYIKTAYEYKLISGYSADAFGPMDPITREQAMAIVAKAMDITGLKVDLAAGEADKLLEAFTDGRMSEEYAKSGIAIGVKTGIISGRTSEIIAPKESITRAEVAAIVRRLLQKSGLI